MSSSLSSTSSSSSSAHHVTLPTLIYTSYPIRRTSHRGSRLILSSTNQPLHLIHASTFTPNTPDITIHTGPTTTTPILGICNFPSLSRNIIIGLGDPSTCNPNAIQWETLSKSSRDYSIYSFSLPLLDPPTNTFTSTSTSTAADPLNPDLSPKQTYMWRRTRHPHKYLNQALNSTTTTHTSQPGIHLPHSNLNLSRRSWKLTSTSTPTSSTTTTSTLSSTGTTTTHPPQPETKTKSQTQTQIHALFTSNPTILSPHNTGTLYIFSSSSSSPSSSSSSSSPSSQPPPPPQEPPLPLPLPWILLTYSAISEKARRRALARRDLSWFF